MNETKKFLDELRVMDAKDLQDLYIEAKREQMLDISSIDTTMKQRTGIKGRMKFNRRNIARMLTIAKERGIEINQERKVES